MNEFPSFDSWYSLSTQDLIQFGGSRFLKKHNNSLSSLLQSNYPNHNWEVWRFKSTPRHFWSQFENQRFFFCSLASILKIRSLSDWYSISNAEIEKYGGQGLLKHYYGGSFIRALKTIYPHHCWQPWRFQKTMNKFWQGDVNRRAYFEWLVRHKGFSIPHLFYALSKNDFCDNHAATLLQHFENTSRGVVVKIFPELKWENWRFANAHVWFLANTLPDFLIHVGEQLKLKVCEDWHFVSKDILRRIGGCRVLDYGFLSSLSHIFPTHKWDEKKWDSESSQSQLWLIREVGELFSKETEFITVLQNHLQLHKNANNVLL